MASCTLVRSRCPAGAVLTDAAESEDRPGARHDRARETSYITTRRRSRRAPRTRRARRSSTSHRRRCIRSRVRRADARWPHDRCEAVPAGRAEPRGAAARARTTAVASRSAASIRTTRVCRMFAHDAQCAVLSVDSPARARTQVSDRGERCADDALQMAAEPRPRSARCRTIGCSAATKAALRRDRLRGAARDAGIRLALQMLIYPGVTGFQDTESHARLANGYLLTQTRSSGSSRNTCAIGRPR